MSDKIKHIKMLVATLLITLVDLIISHAIIYDVSGTQSFVTSLLLILLIILLTLDIDSSAYIILDNTLEVDEMKMKETKKKSSNIIDVVLLMINVLSFIVLMVCACVLNLDEHTYLIVLAVVSIITFIVGAIASGKLYKIQKK